MRLTAKTPFHADLAGHGGDLIGENRERGGHVVDGFGESSDLTLGLHCEVLLEVAVRDSGHDLHDAAHLLGEVGRHDVYGVGEVLPGTGNARHLRLTAELTFGAHFARHAGHLRCERVKLIHHRVDGVFKLENFALHVDRDFAGKIAARHRSRHFGDVAHLRRQVGGQQS